MVNPFSIPNVPTDNLYKFYALSGIFIIIFSIVFSIYFGYKIVDELILLHNSNSMVALEIDFLNSDVEFILNKTKQLENEIQRTKRIGEESCQNRNQRKPITNRNTNPHKPI